MIERSAGRAGQAGVRLREVDLALDQPLASRLLTYGVRIVFRLRDTPVRAVTGRAQESMLIGPRTRPLKVRLNGDHRMVSATLPPWIAFRAFGDSLHGLADRVVRPADILDPLVSAVERDLCQAPSTETRLRLLVAAIRRWCADGPRWSPDLEQAWWLLQDSGGTIRVGELADAVGLSSWALTGRFHPAGRTVTEEERPADAYQSDPTT